MTVGSEYLLEDEVCGVRHRKEAGRLSNRAGGVRYCEEEPWRKEQQ